MNEYLKLLESQKKNRAEILSGSGSVPPGGELILKIPVSTSGSFLAQKMFLAYSTLASAGVDNGVNTLTLSMVDGADNVSLITGCEASLIASPGRVKDGSAPVGAEPLMITDGWNIPGGHLFNAPGEIQLIFRNSGTIAQTVWVCFAGRRMLGAVKGRA